MRRQQGFTLLEVVMVLVILGILRVLGVRAYSSCAGSTCQMAATGRSGTPTAGATVTVVLSGDGTSTIRSSGF